MLFRGSGRLAGEYKGREARVRFLDVMLSREGRPVDLDKAKSECSKRLGGMPVVVLYLHGSYAGGRPGTLSDVDVAALFEDGIEPKRLLDLELTLIGELEAIFEDEGVDLAVLNHAGVDFRYQVVAKGIPLYVGDEAARVDFETQAVDRYLDMRPLRDEYFRAFKRRIREGGLGARRRTA